MAKSILERLYEILSSIETYLRVQCKRNITLIDKKGCTLRNLNKLMNIILLNTINCAPYYQSP